MAAVIEVHDLRDVGQTREQRLEAGVVVAWPAVQQQQGRLLAHARTVSHEAGALDIDEETDTGLDFNAHSRDYIAFQKM